MKPNFRLYLAEWYDPLARYYNRKGKRRKATLFDGLAESH